MKKRILLVLWVVAQAACLSRAPVPRPDSLQQSAPQADEARWVEQAARVTIFRDDFGVAHVYGKSDADAVFGLLYAQCEDDFYRVERNYLWAIGRLAEVEGEDALYSDLRARLFMTRDEAIARFESAPEWLKALCRAFADGINYYLHTHPEVRPRGLGRFEPWMPMYFSEGSIGGDIERVSIEGIRAFYREGSTPAPSLAFRDVDTQEEPRGSNGFAISGKLTASGHPLLLINPHTTFFFRGEYHVVSEEGLNAYGAITWGQFFIYQGFNEKTGWMHTSTYTDVIDHFLETVIDQTDKGGTYLYQYGEEQRPVSALPVTLKYRDRDRLVDRSFTLYRTHHGPVTGKIGEQWVSTALMWEPVNALTQSFIRTKQSGHKGFRQMMEMRTNSSNNTVYADAEGNIAYYHGNFIPRRDTRFDFTQPVDGSDPATDWQGLHAVDESITLLNPPNGWIQNCNSTPFTAAGPHSPKKTDYPGYMSIDRENFRALHAISLLNKASDLTLDDLIDIAHDPYLPGFAELVPGLIRAYDKRGASYPQLAGPITALKQWDLTVTVNSVPMSLMHFYAALCRKQTYFPDKLNTIEKFHYQAHEVSAEQQLELLAQVVTRLTEDFGKWDTPWGEINRYQRLTGDLKQRYDDTQPSLPIGMASGRWGALASYGAKSFDGTKRLYGTSGNSFVAVVEFGPRVRAKTLLAGGQSADPRSPHFDDQAKRYADRQFKEAAYYREDVEARAISVYHPGEQR